MRVLGQLVAFAVLAAAGCTDGADVESDDGSEEAAAEADAAEEADGCCGPPSLQLDSEAADEAVAVPGMAVEGSALFDSQCNLDEESVAGIDLPSNFGAFAAAFSEETTLSFYRTYMVDLSALCVRAGGEDAICAIGFYEDSYSAETAVEGLIVMSELCDTQDGVGPGTPIARAIEAYGEATFGFSWENEGREFVSFENAPAGFSFRARSDTAEASAENAGPNIPGGEHGGDYSDVEGDSYFETTTAYPDAQITEIWIQRLGG